MTTTCEKVQIRIKQDVYFGQSHCKRVEETQKVGKGSTSNAYEKSIHLDGSKGKDAYKRQHHEIAKRTTINFLARLHLLKAHL